MGGQGIFCATSSEEYAPMTGARISSDSTGLYTPCTCAGGVNCSA